MASPASADPKRRTDEEVMKHSITAKGALDHGELERAVGRRVQRIARLLKRFPDDATFLHVVGEELGGTHRHARISLALSLPSRTLACHDEGKHLDEVVREAFDELERLVRREKERLRAEREQERAAARARERLLARLEKGGQGAELPVERFDAISAELPELERFVHREIRLLEAAGDIAWREVDPRDIVDQVVARALERFAERPRAVDLGTWLQTLAARALRAEVDRLRVLRRRAVRIEEDIPETPPEEEVNELGDEILDFYQPDEDLRIEDVLPALGIPTPEEAERTVEFEKALFAALAALPRSWREAFLLRALEEAPVEDVAAVLERDPEEVEREAELARAFLVARLRSAGLVP